MISKSALLLLACFASSLAQGASDYPERILFVGNSYFYYNNGIHNHLKALVKAAIPNRTDTLQYKMATIGGSTLDHQPIEWLTEPGRIGIRKPFEVVILAGNSADALGESSRQKFTETVVKFDRVIKSRGGKTMLYMTHTYVPPNPKVSPLNLGKVVQMYEAAGQLTGADIIPVALAFADSYKRRPDLALHDQQDGSHPSVLGTYLAACVLMAKLYKQNPEGNSYDVHGQLPRDVAEHLQRVAWETVTGRHQE